jgi:hypothetical protein
MQPTGPIDARDTKGRSGDARPSPRQLARLTTGVFQSYALLAGMQLDLFSYLQDGPLTPAELAALSGLPTTRLARLLQALAWAGMLTENQGRYANTPESDQLLVRGRPGFIGDSHAAWAVTWEAALHTAESVRTNRPSGRLDFSIGDPQRTAAVLRGLAPQARLAATDLLGRDLIPPGARILDVAGGSGALLAGLCEARPDVSGTVLELPSVVPVVRELLAELAMTTDLADRIAVLAGDGVRGPLPPGHDVLVLRNFVQLFGPPEIRQILATAAKALLAGQRLCILGYMLDDDRRGPAMALGADLMFLNLYEDGAVYTEAEHCQWLIEAGFTDIVRHHLTRGASLIAAIRA